MARTDTLSNYLTDVANAIREKSGTVGTIQASSFDDAISNISSGGIPGMYKVSSIAEMNELTGMSIGDICNVRYNNVNDVYKYNGTNWELLDEKIKPMSISFQNNKDATIKTKNLDTSLLKTMSSMFSGCTNVEEINVSKFNTSNVTSMSNMFYECRKIENLDLSNFNTSNVTTMQSMFYNCYLLTSLDLSNFDTSKTTSLNALFFGCSNITSINMSGCVLTSTNNIRYMFNGCSKLQNLDISSFDFTNISSYDNSFTGVPNNCLIYVKDQNAKDWIEAHYSNLTNVQIKN